jgi:MoxR-like ATPase
VVLPNKDEESMTETAAMQDGSPGIVQSGAEAAKAVINNVERVIVGKNAVVTDAIKALLSGGHILLEDVPGVGKTMLARSISRSIDGEFNRVQFTADLLPSDVTGVTIYKQQTGEFEFRKGPLFANVMLADEINRATPRTQSSLLEAMEEHQASVDGKRYELPDPFLVIATQNPIELEGTYPLPFAQMDRFIVRLSIGYLDAVGEREMLRARINRSPIEELSSVIHTDDLVRMQKAVRAIKITDELLDYVVAVVRGTREAESVEFGASPRATLDLLRFAQATAFLDGRDHVLPDDVKASAAPVLTHRIVVRKGTRFSSLSSATVVAEILASLPVPV